MYVCTPYVRTRVCVCVCVCVNVVHSFIHSLFLNHICIYIRIKTHDSESRGQEEVQQRDH